ncbi:NAD(P)-dependent oxidoreductase [Paenibacillus sp. V4I5]|uniref:NAD-dependent epimerase/dehydratase family protein n=1 Tax=Paenibacillus sp. V4I5 TaxID=3042306 RepID=UPI00279237AD|nr:NAD-dependent epimerase/dehydratase family protein [Paenibacillus sp. V4I5]MDQ0914681.1 nucleoside-diphosphate-sugar epimerase [Paenibacillus sp. V4I5]
MIRLENVPTIPVPFNEDGPLRTELYPYGGDYEKQLVENTVLSKPLQLPGTVLRLPMVYGEGDSSNRLYKYVKRMLDNRNAVILDDLYANWRGTRGHVENVAHAIALAATNEVAKNRIYNVGEEVSLSEKEWVQLIAKVMKWDGKVHSIPRSDLPEQLIYSLLDLRQDWVVDTSRIRNELNYSELVSIEEAVSRTVDWEENNPPKELHPKDFPRFDYESEDLVLTKIV